MELKALDKGDGNLELQANLATFGGDALLTIGTFPAGDGVHSSFGSGTHTSSDDCQIDEPVTVTAVTTFAIQADPAPG